MSKLTLPTDSAERKNFPMLSGCLKYFPAALAGVAKISKLGNDKHNPGQPLHHARGKSADHGDCILRHLTDTEDLLAAHNRGTDVTPDQVLVEANQLAWRALAYAQELHEKFGAPLAPGAQKYEGEKSCSIPKKFADNIKVGDRVRCLVDDAEFICGIKKGDLLQVTSVGITGIGVAFKHLTGLGLSYTRENIEWERV